MYSNNSEFSRVYNNFKCRYKKSLETYWRHRVWTYEVCYLMSHAEQMSNKNIRKLTMNRIYGSMYLSHGKISYVYHTQTIHMHIKLQQSTYRQINYVISSVVNDRGEVYKFVCTYLSFFFSTFQNKYFFWELIFIYFGPFFFLILVVFFFSFFVVSSFTTFRPNFTSGLLQVIYRDLG